MQKHGKLTEHICHKACSELINMPPEKTKNMFFINIDRYIRYYLIDRLQSFEELLLLEYISLELCCRTRWFFEKNITRK